MCTQTFTTAKCRSCGSEVNAPMLMKFTVMSVNLTVNMFELHVLGLFWTENEKFWKY